MIRRWRSSSIDPLSGRVIPKWACAKKNFSVESIIYTKLFSFTAVEFFTYTTEESTLKLFEQVWQKCFTSNRKRLSAWIGGRCKTAKYGTQWCCVFLKSCLIEGLIGVRWNGYFDWYNWERSVPWIQNPSRTNLTRDLIQTFHPESPTWWLDNVTPILTPSWRRVSLKL